MTTDPADETEEQRADQLQTERAHAEGEHAFCGLSCEATFPSEMLRNGILYAALPGSAAMLDELLRRAARPVLGTATTPPESAPAVDRRARYAAAIRDTDGWVLDNGQHMIDAVMAVADDDITEALRISDAATNAMQDADRAENARLRAEVERLRADQATTRDRIRRAICETDGQGHLWGTDMLEPDEYGEVADAVLAVLPAPAAPVTVLREAADELTARAAPDSERGAGVRWAADYLRRLADEAQQPAPAVTEEAPPQCSAGLLPATDAAVDRCVRRGPHDTHRTAAGALWPNT